VVTPEDAVIVEALRTPVGRRRGALAGWHPVDPAAEVVRALVERSGIDPASVDDVIVGCVDQVGEQSLNVARSIALAAAPPRASRPRRSTAGAARASRPPTSRRRA
jgi:acetyl-CoA acetyltransferase